MNMLRSFIVLWVVVFSYSNATGQEMQPYIITDDGERHEFEEIKITFYVENFKCIDKDGKKTKFKPKNVRIALIGKKGEYDPKVHKQYICGNVKTKLGKEGKGTYIQKGNDRLYVIIKKDDNYLASQYVDFGNGQAATLYYLIEGDQSEMSKRDNWLQEEFYDRILDIFGDCEEAAAVIKNYQKDIKRMKFYDFLDELSLSYYKNCFEE